MVDIDERVVQMKFDSSDFEEKTKSTFKVLDTLKEKLSFKKEISDSDNLNSVAENVQKMADKAYTIVDRMIDKIKDDIANKLLKFLNENTIGQIASGWSKYADMTTSVATLKSQGYALEDINEQLARLNYFTDETSYKFTDMVREIGKFTASGQSLEDATLAMMGIANWAALSGKNANDASRAMYQLSQALSAGSMRLVDWKSIQNLNMDTIEFRKNAIAAAIEVGTLKDNLNGTYTTLAGKKAGSLTFTLNQFSDNLTEGAWFTSEVMMKVYGMYANAVDEIREIYEEGGTRFIDGVEYNIETTADAIKYAEDRNEKIIEKFKDTKLGRNEIEELLKKWKKVEKVTDESVENYMKINKITDKMVATDELNKDYAEYLKEYSQIFGESEENAEKALDDWQDYISDFGMKAFRSSQEAKTFMEAIESAKDAASTVWMNMFQLIFGNYDEARALWTDLANGLYEIFVERLNDLHKIISNWYGKGGRTVLFQGVYAFFGGIGEFIRGLREGWNSIWGGGGTEAAGQRLLTFSERFRMSMFRFYQFIADLKGDENIPNTFFKNIGVTIQNVLKIFGTFKTIVLSVIKSFLPSGMTLAEVLTAISLKIRELSEKLVPSQKTALNIARILRGIVSIFRLIGKIAVSVFKIIEPFIVGAFDVITQIVSVLLEVGGIIGEFIYQIEDTIHVFDVLSGVGSALVGILRFLAQIVISVLGVAFALLGPIIQVVIGTLNSFKDALADLFSGSDNQSPLEKILDKFRNLNERIKNAWSSTESLADTFNRFRGGSGLGNFLEMIGTMCMNVVRKIGNVIVAIFGLEDVVKNGAFANEMKNFKDLLGNIFIGIKWVWTNVISPVLIAALQGSKNVLNEIFRLISEGDIMGILEYVGKTIKIIGGSAFVKVLFSLANLLKSGGVLRVVRNTASALKALGKLWNAKALNERSTAMLKLTIAMGLLLGYLFILSQMDIDKLWEPLGILGAILGGLTVSVILLSVAVQFCKGGLFALTAAFLSLSLFVGLTIITVKKLAETIDGISNLDKYYAAGGILTVISAGLMAFLATLAFIGSRIPQVANVGVALIGIGVSLLGFAIALEKAVNIINNNSFEEVAQAFLIVAGGIITLTVAMRLMSGVMGYGGKNIKSAFVPALFTVVSILTFVFVLLPGLEALAEKMDKFEEYMQGLALFALMILSISGALALISASGGTIKSFVSLVVFVLLTNYLKNGIIPFIRALSTINFDQAIGGVTLFAITINAIALALLIVSHAIQNVFEGLAKLKFGGIIALLLGIAGVIATISILAHLMDRDLISVGAIIGSLAILGSVLLMLALFVNSLSANLTSAKKAEHMEKMVSLLMGLIISIGVLVFVGVAEAHYLFGNNTEAMAMSFLLTSLSIIRIIVAVAISFSLMIKSISNSLSNGTVGENVVKVLQQIFKIVSAIGIILVALLGEAMLWNLQGGSWVSFEAILVTIFAGMSTLLGLLGSSFAKIINALSGMMKKNGTHTAEYAIKFLKWMTIFMGVFVGALSALMISIGTTFANGYEWQSAVILGVTFAGIAVVIHMLTTSFQKIFKLITPKVIDNFGKYETIIVTFGVIMAGLILAIGGAFAMMTKYQDYTHRDNLILNAIVLIGTFAAVVFILTRSFTTIFNTMKGTSKISGSKLAIIESVLATILISMLEMTLLLDKLNEVELVDSGAAIAGILTFATIAGSIFLVVFGLLKTMKGLTISSTKLGVIITTLASIIFVLFIMGESLIPSLAYLEDVSGGAIFSALSGVALIVLAIGAVVIAMGKLLRTKDLIPALAGTGIALLSLITIMGTISVFGQDLADFYERFENISWEGILAALGSLGLVVAAMFGVGLLISGLVTSKNYAALIGMALAVPIMLITFGLAMAAVGDTIAAFIEKFDNLREGTVLKAVAALGGILTLMTVFGAIIGVISTVEPAVAVAAVLLPLLFLSLGGALALVGDTITDFFLKFEDISWESVALGLLTLAGLVAITTTLGNVAVVSIPGILTFIGTLAALALVLKLVASAITDMRIALGDESYLSYMERIGKMNAQYFNKGFTKTEGIKSPSKTFNKYGKYIDQGLAQGLKKNMSTVKKASNTLAIVTNDEFCDELGIASPSKVFYENGRFIVAGLIGGMDSQSSKLNNQGFSIGNSIADGISEGLDQSDIASKFNLFGDSDMASVIKDALGEGGKTILEGAYDDIFGSEDYITHDMSQLTEEERKRYNELFEYRKALERGLANVGVQQKWRDQNNEWQYLTVTSAEIQYYQNKLQQTQTEMDTLYQKAEKKTSKLQGLLTDGVSNGFSFGFDNVLNGGILDIKLDGIFGKISDFIKGDGSSSLSTAGENVLTTLFGSNGEGGTMSKTISGAGESAGGSFISGIVSKLTGDGSIGAALKEKLGDIWNSLMGSTFGHTIMDLSDRLGLVDEDKMNEYLRDIGEKIEVEDSFRYEQFKKEWQKYAVALKDENRVGIEAPLMWYADETGLKNTMDRIEKEIYEPLRQMGIEEADLLHWSLMKGLEEGIGGSYNLNGSWVIKDYEALAKWIEDFWVIKSPSHRMQKYMKYIWEGGEVGTKEEAPKLLKAVDTVMNDMSDEFEEVSIAPKLTPVWDDNSITMPNISEIYKPFTTLEPQIDATVSSFMRDMPNYDSKLDDLQKSIDNMTQLVCDAIINSSEDTNVNINIEPDGDGLFKYMVNQVKMRNKRVPGSGLFG